MARNTLKYDLNRLALAGDGEHGHKPALSDTTIRNYKSYNEHFCDWAKEHGIKTFAQLDKYGKQKAVQDYADWLKANGKSAHTIHSYIAPVCKACGFSMAKIEKDKRTSADIKRGRYVVDRSEREENLGRYAKGVELQKAIGIRRNELSHLTGKDLLVDREGRLYVRVEKGKGGKKQFQRVLPEHEAVVLSAFKGVGRDEHVLKADQISKNINYHGFRADLAKEAYRFYASMPEKDREKVRQFMIRKYESLTKTSEKQKKAFIQRCYDDRPYRLRGENLKLALEKGLPVEYDRFALLAVSVEHLSHWGLSTTVCNYMLA